MDVLVVHRGQVGFRSALLDRVRLREGLPRPQNDIKTRQLRSFTTPSAHLRQPEIILTGRRVCSLVPFPSPCPLTDPLLACPTDPCLVGLLRLLSLSRRERSLSPVPAPTPPSSSSWKTGVGRFCGRDLSGGRLYGERRAERMTMGGRRRRRWGLNAGVGWKIRGGSQVWSNQRGGSVG